MHKRRTAKNIDATYKERRREAPKASDYTMFETEKSVNLEAFSSCNWQPKSYVQLSDPTM